MICLVNFVKPFAVPFVAIFVATVVYRWQKGIDRQTAVSIEMRKEYSNFWSIIQNSYGIAEKGSLSYGDPDTNNLVASLSYIDLYGEKKIYAICKEIFENLMRLSGVNSPENREEGDGDVANEKKISDLKKLMELNLKLRKALEDSHRNHLSMFPKW